MEQKNHFTIRDESGGVPLIEITRRADVADGEMVELLQLFIAALMEGTGETPAPSGESDVAGQSLKDRLHVRLVAENEKSEVTPLALLIKAADLETSNVVDLELVRLRAKNKAVREALGFSGTEPGER